MNNLSIEESKPVAVIFAGGGGTRLWPISTSSLPKQINPAFSKKTLLKEAFERALKLFPKERIVVVATKELEKKVRDIVKLPKKNFIIQPKNADTAMAMCLTALHLETLFSNSTAIIFYSDHKITKCNNFKKSINDLVEIAKKHSSLVTIGTWPTVPSTQFGYIKLGKRAGVKNLYKVKAFREKPDLKTAKRYLKDKKHVWNTGVYAWKSSVFLSVLKKVAPSFYSDLVELKISIGEKQYEKKVVDWFEQKRPASFEKIVSEKLSDMFVYVADYSWNDIGNWKTIYDLAKKDKNGNAIINREDDQKINLVSSSNNTILSESKKIALVGIKDLIIVQNNDSLLICNRNKIDDIKKITKKF